MENIAAVQELEKQVRRRMADVTFTIDAPLVSTGSWWIDVQRYGRVASIEWKPSKGFGVAAPNGGYGEGVDFIVDDAAAAAEYVTRVLQPYSAEVDTTGLPTAQREMVVALAAHLDRFVSEIVHSTIEKLLRELRKQVGDEPMNVDTFERKLSRIADEVLAERKHSKNAPDGDDSQLKRN